ncbi:UPF1 [Symbiodinium sp. CCMP2456]|nr:UPF1 [Symbiodinium sp. CCMP2456]
MAMSPFHMLSSHSSDLQSESEELEVCCICLDSLCTRPVVVMLKPGGQSLCCPHYLHAECAERLRPRRCPICRSRFGSLSIPMAREMLQDMAPARIMTGLRFLAGSEQGETVESEATVPVRVAIPLLSALLPLRQATLAAYVEQEVLRGDQTGLGPDGLKKVLRRVGLGQGGRPSGGAAGGLQAEGYSLALRLSRRLRRLALKFAGATGAALHLGAVGMLCGMLVGCLGALPRIRLRHVRNNIEDLDEFNSMRVLLLYVVTVIALELLLLSIRDPRWVKRGLRVGAMLGAVLGWLRALAVVDPDRHGFGRVFQQGLSGETTWPRHWRILEVTGAPMEKVDIFTQRGR